VFRMLFLLLFFFFFFFANSRLQYIIGPLLEQYRDNVRQGYLRRCSSAHPLHQNNHLKPRHGESE